jgi:lysozyme
MSIQKNHVIRVLLPVMQWAENGGRQMDLEKLKSELRRDEGLRLEVYRCTTGHRTIGYGHLVDQQLSVSACTEEEAEQWLADDIMGAIRIVEIFLWPTSIHELTEKRQRALANMAFNLGMRLCKFKKLRDALRAKDWNLAAREILDSLYAKQVGKRALRIAAMIGTEDEGV